MLLLGLFCPLYASNAEEILLSFSISSLCLLIAIASGEFSMRLFTGNYYWYIACSSLLNTLSCRFWEFLIRFSISASCFSSWAMLDSRYLLYYSTTITLFYILFLPASILACISISLIYFCRLFYSRTSPALWIFIARMSTFYSWILSLFISLSCLSSVASWCFR